jgi:hypothetical protein
MADDISFLQEIDESLRADKLQIYLERYGKLFVAGAVLIVLLTGASVMWKNHLNALDSDATDKIFEAKTQAEAGKTAEAAAILEQVAANGRPSAALALMREGMIWDAKGDRTKALDCYRRASTLSGADAAMKDKARLAAAILATNDGKAADDAEAASAGRPFAGAFGELQAVQLLNQGKTAEAQTLLKAVKDNPAASQGERERASELLGLSAAGSGRGQP